MTYPKLLGFPQFLPSPIVGGAMVRCRGKPHHDRHDLIQDEQLKREIERYGSIPGAMGKREDRTCSCGRVDAGRACAAVNSFRRT